jgi:hypothetical protein
MPNFLVEETTVRSGGEGPVLALGATAGRHLLLTLSVSHVIERQDLDVDVFASGDGVSWSPEPVATFLQRFGCGSYEMILPNCEARFLKAAWRVSRWGRSEDRPLCRFSLAVQERSSHENRSSSNRTRAMAGAA